LEFNLRQASRISEEERRRGRWEWWVWRVTDRPRRTGTGQGVLARRAAPTHLPCLHVELDHCLVLGHVTVDIRVMRVCLAWNVGVCQLDTKCRSRRTSVVPSPINRQLGPRTERKHQHQHLTAHPRIRPTNNDNLAARKCHRPLANPSICPSPPLPEWNDGDDLVVCPLTNKDLPVFPHLDPGPPIADEEREVKYVLDCLAE
jgi:hypothetical protein